MRLRMPQLSRRSAIGLDCGSVSIHAAQLQRKGSIWIVTRLAQAVHKTPNETSTSQGDKKEDSFFDGLNLTGFRGRKVAMSLNMPDVEFVSLELPEAMLKQDIAQNRSAIRFEMERLISNHKETVEIRHWLLPATNIPAPNALGAAASMSSVTKWMDITRKSGLTCVALDAAALAQCRFAGVLRPSQTGTVRGVLDLGHVQARLIVCIDDVPVLVRAVGAGGRTLTQKISQSLKLSEKASEVLKREHGITVLGRRQRDQVQEPSPQGESEIPPAQSTKPAATRPDSGPAAQLGATLFAAVRGDLSELAAEIKRSYEYVLSCYPDRQAGDLFLVGGGAGLPHLPQFLGNSLGITALRAEDCLHGHECRLRCEASKSDSLDGYATAIGIALDD